ncbi:MAG: hypothetical protein IAE89_00280 [Anaerolineae bacterium]|nr:hypothetical protein [Anaerolineae bacterium]
MEKLACPHCGGEMVYDSTAALYRCHQCGNRVEKAYESLEQAQARLAENGSPRPNVPITHQGAVEPRVQTLFEMAQDGLWRKNTAEAKRLLKKALEMQPDFSDAHLWLAKLTDDAATKRHHLGEILARDPGHPDALRMMMVLNGRISPDQVAATRRENSLRPELVTEPVEAAAEALLCPVCGGALTVDEAAGTVLCKFCGHQAALESASALEGRADNLSMAMLERRAKPVRWKIGARMLRCGECGAARTIPARKLSARCPFCGSMQVVIDDALETITEPDGLVPFALNEDQVMGEVREKLAGFSERLSTLWGGDNRVANAEIEGVYLPFWIFDALIKVGVTLWDDSAKWGDQRSLQSGKIGYQQFNYQDGAAGIAVPAFKSPDPALALKLGEFELGEMLPYEPKLLAKYPAEIYEIDFDAASLEARTMMARRAREAAEAQYTDRNTKVSATAFPLQMSFQLVLLPVWVATLFERDGDLRTALIHGQTGQVALGKARKPASK